MDGTTATNGGRLGPGVALTAIAMAHEREVESQRRDLLFCDPWASEMVAAGRVAVEASASWVAEMTLADIAPGMAGYVAARTRWIDDRILTYLRHVSGAQLVLLGAGLDTRAARLPLPRDLTTYQLDQPAVVELASSALGVDDARLIFVPSDLAGGWAEYLARHGFTPDRPTIWVVEGVLMYLHAHQAQALVGALRGLSAEGSALIADLAHPHVHRNALFGEGRRTLEGNGSPLRSSVVDPPTWLADHGWIGQVADPVAVAAAHGREVPPALDPRLSDGPSFQLVEATIR